MFFHPFSEPERAKEIAMKMARLRKTGVQVSAEAVENLWLRLYALWQRDPLSFIELVRHARKRNYQIEEPTILKNLYGLGFIADGRNFPVHDSIRELIGATVEGDGIRMMLFRPFQNDDKAVSELVTLRSGDRACVHIVRWAVNKLEQLMVADYALFTELTRFVRDGKDAAALYGDSLQRLLRSGLLRIRMTGTEQQQAIHALYEMFLGGMLIDGPRKLTCEPVLELVIRNAVIGKAGLSFTLQDPVQPKKAGSNGQAPHGVDPSRNGHARKDEVPAGTH